MSSLTGKDAYRVRPLDNSDVAAVIDLVNEAFMEDAFFKVPEKRQRLKKNDDDGADMGVESFGEVLRTSTFLVAESMCESNELLGCIRVDRSKATSTVVGSFGMLSVPKRNQNRGIGKALVRAAEEYALNELACKRLEIAVVNIRTPVVRFYQGLGYREFGEPVDFDGLVGGEFLAPEYKGIVKFIWMGKYLV